MSQQRERNPARHLPARADRRKQARTETRMGETMNAAQRLALQQQAVKAGLTRGASLGEAARRAGVTPRYAAMLARQR